MLDNVISEVLLQRKGPKEIWPTSKLTKVQEPIQLQRAMDMMVERRKLLIQNNLVSNFGYTTLLLWTGYLITPRSVIVLQNECSD